MDLREASRFIVESDQPAEQLRLADMYIHSFNQMPQSFVLPADHAILKPVIEAFHDDIDLFVKYVRAIRDQLPAGDDKVDVQHLYRTLVTRTVQQARRARIHRALEVVESIVGRQLDQDERDRVATKLERLWAYKRMEVMKQARGDTTKGRLSSDVRADVLKGFWDAVDRDIENRHLPIFNI